MTSKLRSPSFATLTIELRLLIWRYIYNLQSPRLVEVQSAPHENCKSHNEGFCPRWSPSPAPVIVNICQESRRVAFEIARECHHLFFSTPFSPPIFFNPEIDTLYVPDEKSIWIRGPDGILTQLKAELGLDINRLRILAADLNPYASQEGSMKADLKDFPGIQDYILLVTDLKDGDFERFKAAERVFQIIKLRKQRRNVELNSQTFSTIRRQNPWLKFAIKRGGSLRFIEEGTTMVDDKGQAIQFSL